MYIKRRIYQLNKISNKISGLPFTIFYILNNLSSNQLHNAHWFFNLLTKYIIRKNCMAAGHSISERSVIFLGTIVGEFLWSKAEKLNYPLDVLTTLKWCTYNQQLVPNVPASFNENHQQQPAMPRVSFAFIFKSFSEKNHF